MSPSSFPRRRRAVTLAAATSSLLLLAACGESTAAESDSAEQSTATTNGAVFDASMVHTIAIELDETDYSAMVEAYRETREKEWLSVTVTVDGDRHENVGLRLKGNSSLMSITADTEPSEVPWLIKLDKFVDDQSVDGYTEFVVRSNSTETALNEAVALDLLDEAGLASEHAVATRLSVNGGAEELRLVVQNPDDTWDDENFTADGILYKAEAGGDYSYRGEDATSYEEIFDQETGVDEDDLDPLIDFLEFINDSDDATFSAELANHLDVDAFATYLAFEDLIDNFDDIDGPGNNSYLRYDEEAKQFTVVAWDHNLAFGVSAIPGAGDRPQGGVGGQLPEGVELPEGMELPEGAEGMELPEGVELPEGMEPPAGSGGFGAGSRSNILVERFKADPEFEALYQQASAELKTSLFDSGTAQTVLDGWVQVLSEQAGDLLDDAIISSEADAIRESVEGDEAAD